MVYVNTDNTMNTRSVSAITLEQSNENGGHYFMNLHTGHRIHSYKLNKLPIDDDVIARFKAIVKIKIKKGHWFVKEKYPLF